PALNYFLENGADFSGKIKPDFIKNYIKLDDNDIFQSIKCWSSSDDPILSDLCRRFRARDLYRTTFFDDKPSEAIKESVASKTAQQLSKSELPADKISTSFYFNFGESYSEAYRYEEEEIYILEDENKITEFSKAADTRNIIALTQPVVKPYLVHLKEIEV